MLKYGAFEKKNYTILYHEMFSVQFLANINSLCAICRQIGSIKWQEMLNSRPNHVFVIHIVRNKQYIQSFFQSYVNKMKKNTTQVHLYVPIKLYIVRVYIINALKICNIQFKRCHCDNAEIAIKNII